MAEDPIKLFSSRAERYPEPTEADIVQGTARAALAAIPFVGGSITEALSMVLAPAVTRREELTIWHIRFLQLFHAPFDVLASMGVRFNTMGGFGGHANRVFNYTMGGPSTVLELAYPELKDKREFYDQISADLRTRGMLNSPADFLHTTMSANGMLG